ncbi:MAG: hypothetical protein ACRDD9_18155 [Shewanella sp.]
MHNELIARFNLPSERLTGRHETSSLTDIEIGLGNYIASCFDGMTVTDTAYRRNKGVQAFISKPRKDRVICGQFDDPQSVLNALSAKKHEANALPVVNVSFPSGFGYADGEAYRDVHNCSNLCTADGTAIGIASKMFMRGTATIMVLAEDKPTVSAISSTLGASMRLLASLGKATFAADTMVMGVPITLAGEIENPKMVQFDPVTLPFNETRLYGLSMTVDVVGEVLHVYELEPKAGAVELYVGLMK